MCEKKEGNALVFIGKMKNRDGCCRLKGYTIGGEGDRMYSVGQSK